MELLIVCTEYHSHAAGPKQFDDTVVAQHLTDFWRRNHGSARILDRGGAQVNSPGIRSA
jgi:hypothetical protein